MSHEHLSPAETNRLLQAGLISGDFVLASGRHSTEKFDFDQITSGSELFSRVVAGLASCIRTHFAGFDSILTVANGATRLGVPLSTQLDVAHIQSTYRMESDGRKKFSVYPAKGVTRAIIVDDVFTRGTNAAKVIKAAQQYGIQPLGIAVVLDRSGFNQPVTLGNVAVHSVVQRHLH